VLNVVKVERVVNEKCPTARLINEELCKLTGDEGHGFELGVEKSPTTANKMFAQWCVDV
jgi:hypothetical protein